MEQIRNPHDRLFKETWSRKENARGFLRQYLPDYLLSSIDLDSLEICKDSFVEEELRRISDFGFRKRGTRVTQEGHFGFLFPV